MSPTQEAPYVNITSMYHTINVPCLPAHASPRAAACILHHCTKARLQHNSATGHFGQGNFPFESRETHTPAHTHKSTQHPSNSAERAHTQAAPALLQPTQNRTFEGPQWRGRGSKAALHTTAIATTTNQPHSTQLRCQAVLASGEPPAQAHCQGTQPNPKPLLYKQCCTTRIVLLLLQVEH